MKRVLFFFSFLSQIIIFLWSPDALIASNKPETLLKQQNSKTGFIENKGQIIDQNNKPNPGVLYLLNSQGMNVQLRREGFSYDLFRISNIDQRFLKSDRKSKIVNQCSIFENNPRYKSSDSNSVISFHRIDFDLQNANPNPTIETSTPSSDYMNYYTTGTPVGGVTFVRSYSTVTYKNIYPGIDLQFIAEDERLFEYNFILQPGADIGVIKLKVSGPEKIKKYKDGIHLETSIGEIDEMIPVSYFSRNDIRVPVKGRFKKIGEHLYGFAVDQAVPPAAVLIIDPVPTRRWGTYYVGGDITNAGCATDSTGNVYICGFTGDPFHIATIGAFQSTFGGIQDAYLAKFSTTGQRLWGTYYGGNGGDQGYSCATDRYGNVFLVGAAGSATVFATPGAYQTFLRGGQDAFVAKFNSAGMRIWGTYYGGNEVYPPGGEFFSACAVDTLGNVYCAGETTSPDFIASPGGEQTVFGGVKDGFLVKFTGDGQWAWATYYGGTNWEQNMSCTVSKNGFVYLSGNTFSPNNIATPGSFMPIYTGLLKAFLACFNLDGQRFWGTYFGGNGPNGDIAYGCIADTASNVYLYGNTGSTNNIGTSGVFQPTSTTGGGYLEKFSSAGARLWGTYYGNSQIEGAAVDDSGFVYIAGAANTQVQDTLIASSHAYQTVNRGGMDALLAKLTSSGQRIWGTYYGGTDWEYGMACAVDHSDNIYLAGYTSSVNNTSNTGPCTRNPYANIIATPGSLYTEIIYPVGGYLVKFADCYSPDTALQINGPASLCVNSTGFVYAIAPIASAIDYHWCVTGDLIITAGQNTTSITLDVGPTLGIDTISVYGINSCDTGFPKVIIRRVYQRPIPMITGSDTTCTGLGTLYITAGGKINYQWSVSPGGTMVAGGTATDSACTIIWSNGGAQWVRLNYSDTTGCSALTPTQFNVWVIVGPPVSVTISASLNSVCEGTSVSFNAIGINGGLAPSYQWKVNGINTGANNSAYTYTPVNGDVVTCVFTSDGVCASGNPATSNPVIMVIISNSVVGVSIAASANPACAGIPVTFTATPVNGGSSPQYQWKVNGINAGGNSPIYTYSPLNGDAVSCVLSSGEICTTNNPATSNQVIMVIIGNSVVGVSVSASTNPFCPGNSVTFTATPVNGGSAPIYQWKVNGANAGTNSPTYTYNPLSGDLVSCILTSNLSCVTGNPATSNTIIMSGTLAPIVTFTRCFDSITTTNAKPFKLKGGIPLGGTYSGPGVNPVTGIFNPALAGVGAHQITYTYTNAALCSANAIVPIVMIVPPVTTCGQILTDIRDGKTYLTIQIGSQCWMAEDLNYGTEIPFNIHQRDNCISEKYLNPASSIQHPASVYQWDEIMNYDEVVSNQGLCPPGWHVPSESDWNILFTNYINNGFAASPLKYSGYSGFNALLSGTGHFNKTWDYQGFAVIFWSSATHGFNKAWAHGMNDTDPSVSNYPSLRSNAFSVRCLKD